MPHRQRRDEPMTTPSSGRSEPPMPYAAPVDPAPPARSDAAAAALAYWIERLRSPPPTLELPTDRPRRTHRPYRAGRTHLSIAPGLRDALSDCSRQEGVTPDVTMLAVFAVLLHRYSGGEDFVMGWAPANRKWPILPMRIDVSGNPAFHTLLGRVHTLAKEALANQELPFDELVEVMQSEPITEGAPLLRTTFAIGDVTPTSQFTKLPGEVDGAAIIPARMDVTLSAVDETRLVLEYDATLFDESSMSRMLGHFQTLLQQIVTDADRRILDLQILTTAERNQLLNEWRTNPFDYPEELCFHRIFQEQVERTPDAVAIIFEGAELTYRQLNQRANQLAHHLQALGIGPERTACVFMERSFDLAISVIAILKAGGACVPFQPGAPKDRTAAMCEDAQVSIILTHARHQKELPESQPGVICLDDIHAALTKESVENPPSAVTDDNLAFVFFTSGSTGRPKGVMGTHRSHATGLLWLQHSAGLTPKDRHLMKASVTFSPFLRELFSPLFIGGTVIMARPGGEQDTAYLVRLIAEHFVTVISFVPSALKVFLQEPNIERCQSLRHVISGGEAATIELQEQFFASLEADWHLYYGASEAPGATFRTCSSTDEHRTVSLGRATAMEVFVLDSRLMPVPIGVPGDIYIGGAGMARGYLDPELTAERFIRHPVRHEPGARVYKTGDSGRFRQDGTLEFLGRNDDDMVKIRGFRVDLREIEAVLDEHPAVRQSVVQAREESPGDIRLAAYVIYDSQPRPTSSEVRAYLKTKVPQYMIPQHIVEVDAFPVLPNGKIDRQALPDPRLRLEPEGDYVAPATASEILVANVWHEALDIDTVSVHDTFYDVGGDSLLAVRVIAKIADQTGLRLHPTFMVSQTVGQLAAAIDQHAEAQCPDGGLREERQPRARRFLDALSSFGRRRR